MPTGVLAGFASWQVRSGIVLTSWWWNCTINNVPQSATEFKEENFIKQYHAAPSIIHKIIE